MLDVFFQRIWKYDNVVNEDTTKSLDISQNYVYSSLRVSERVFETHESDEKNTSIHDVKLSWICVDQLFWREIDKKTLLRQSLRYI